jgi:hypothetical protein
MNGGGMNGGGMNGGGRPVAALIILLPERVDTVWVTIVRERVAAGAAALAEPLGLMPPSVVVTRQGSEAVLLAGAARHPLHVTPTPVAIATAALHVLFVERWSVLMAPALAARGIGAGRWLSHAARRGLTCDALAHLARDDAAEEMIAWRLADAHPPAIGLMAGQAAQGPVSEEGFRRAVAQAAADGIGLPVPIPGAAAPDPLLDDDEVVVTIGALRCPVVRQGGIATILGLIAPALIDPALAIAVLTDEARIPPRLGALALARGGPVAVAEALLRAVELAPRPVDAVAVVERAAGLVPLS